MQVLIGALFNQQEVYVLPYQYFFYDKPYFLKVQF